MKPRHSARSGASAQSLVEFAFTLPVFLVMLLAMIDFGLGVYAYNTTSYAAQEGMRRGIVLGKDCGAYLQAGNKQNIVTGTTPAYFTNGSNGVPANQAGQQTFTTTSITTPVVCTGTATARSTIVGAVSNALGLLDRANARVVIRQAPGGTNGNALPAVGENVQVHVMYRHQAIWGFLIDGVNTITQSNFDLILSASSTGEVQ